MTDLPKVSFVMPALNAAGIIENCLKSIRRQDYPQDCIEILVGDAGSNDGTPDLVRKYGGQVFPDNGRNIEDGKRAALIHATGDYIVFIDADNEITHPDYIRLAVDALSRHPEAFGVESYYLPSPKMTSFCAYLTHLLHISDPVAWMMSIEPVFLAREGDVERWSFPKGSLAYPVGSNGFVFRRSELDLASAREQYSDTHTSVRLVQATGKRQWLRIRGRGVHHYYVATLGEFLKKRRRATCHFLDMEKEYQFSWTERKPRVPGWLACLCCATLVVPLLQTLIGLARTRDIRWLWHPWASFASVCGVIWGVQTYYFARRGDAKLIHKLQPRQKLESSAEPETKQGFSPRPQCDALSDSNMSLRKRVYDFAYKFRQGRAGTLLANAWHRFAPPITVHRRIYGVDICMDLRDSLYWWGVDRARIEAIEGLEKILAGVKGSVWDIGCNVGIFSLYAASLGYAVTAFDLSPKAIALLQKGAKRNGFKISTVARAFSTTEFRYVPPTDADTRNKAKPIEGLAGGNTSITFQEAEAKFGTPGLIKMDIEHHEIVFLKSKEFKDWIKNKRIALIMELHEEEFWDLVWPDVPHTRFDSHHVYFNPPKPDSAI